MRVLHFYKTYFPDSVGGVEQVIRQLCVGTARLGVTSEVLTLTRDKQNRTVQFEGHTVHRVPLNFEIASTGFSVEAVPRLAKLVRNFDIVHYHFPWPFMDITHFLAGVRIPSIVTYHSDIVRQKSLLKLYQPLQRRFLKSVDCIIATSPNYLASSAVLEQHRDKVKVVTYGLDKRIYPAPSDQLLAQWRTRLGERFFLFVGVLRYYKGLHILLEAAQGTEYPIVIVGAGPIEQDLKEQARKLGVRNVTFLGALPEEDKVALLHLCYAVVFPSHLRSEAFGISLLEGAMYGKPMISSEIGTGTSYINIHNETGLVVPPSNPDAFREAMHRLWQHPEVVGAMGERAEARYRALFTADAMAANYSEVYRQLLQEKRGDR